jgi:hypothetical protein
MIHTINFLPNTFAGLQVSFRDRLRPAIMDVIQFILYMAAFGLPGFATLSKILGVIRGGLHKRGPWLPIPSAILVEVGRLTMGSAKLELKQEAALGQMPPFSVTVGFVRFRVKSRHSATNIPGPLLPRIQEILGIQYPRWRVCRFQGLARRRIAKSRFSGVNRLSGVGRACVKKNSAGPTAQD